MRDCPRDSARTPSMYGITYSLRDGCTYLRQIPLTSVSRHFSVLLRALQDVNNTHNLVVINIGREIRVNTSAAALREAVCRPKRIYCSIKNLAARIQRRIQSSYDPRVVHTEMFPGKKNVLLRSPCRSEQMFELTG